MIIKLHVAYLQVPWIMFQLPMVQKNWIAKKAHYVQRSFFHKFIVMNLFYFLVFLLLWFVSINFPIHPNWWAIEFHECTLLVWAWLFQSSNFELKGFNTHVWNLSSPHARRRLIGCANFKRLWLYWRSQGPCWWKRARWWRSLHIVGE